MAFTLTANQLTENTIIMELSSMVVVDSNLFDVTNYLVEVIDGAGDIAIRKIVNVMDPARTHQQQTQHTTLIPIQFLTTDSIIIHVDKPTKGTTYRITATNLTSTDGSLVSGIGDFIGYRTKIETLRRSIPNHFDKKPESILSSLLIAIGREDDFIGGTGLRLSGLPNILLLEDGEPLLTEDLDTILIEE
jgi:hypothetical protein